MSGPYRAKSGAEVLRAPTREGMARLEVSPRQTLLQVGGYNLAVTGGFVTVNSGHLRRRPRSLRLEGARLFVAQGVPVEEVGIWYEGRPGVAARIFGLRPIELLDGAALIAWQSLDRLSSRLRAALAPHRGDAIRAKEFGGGADRVLVVDYDDRYVVYVRRLFREHPRRALEVRDDGTVVIPRKNGDTTIECRSRFGVTVLGDLIRFADPGGEVLAQLWLPWITPEDRVLLARSFGERLHQERLTPPQ